MSPLEQEKLARLYHFLMVWHPLIELIETHALELIAFGHLCDMNMTADAMYFFTYIVASHLSS